MSANNKQIGGGHYKQKIQTWDFISVNNIPYLEGNIIKYVVRYKRKNGLEDLNKAKHYLEKLIEIASEEEDETQGEKEIITARSRDGV